MHSVPFPRVGILGALGFVMSYFIVCLLFRLKIGLRVLSIYQSISCFLRGIIFLFSSPFLFIYILLLIIYKYYKGGILKLGVSFFN